jgi:hypothetical protein
VPRHAVLRGFDETDILPFGGTLGPLKIDSGAIGTFDLRASISRLSARDGLDAASENRYSRPRAEGIVRWAAKGDIPLKVDGRGLFDFNLHRQAGRLIVHVVNLTATGRMPIDELVPAGPLDIRLRLPRDVRGHIVKPLVAARSLAAHVDREWVRVEPPSVLDHEVLVIE